MRYNSHKSHCIFVVAFSFFGENGRSFSALCLVVRQPHDAGTNTHPRLCNPFLFCEIDTREDANTQGDLEQVPFNSTCTVVVRGVILAKGPDSSVGRVPVVYCPDDGHMEEEVQLKVQVEGRTGETHGKEQGEEQRVKEQTTLWRTTWMTM